MRKNAIISPGFRKMTDKIKWMIGTQVWEGLELEQSGKKGKEKLVPEAKDGRQGTIKERAKNNSRRIFELC